MNNIKVDNKMLHIKRELDNVNSQIDNNKSKLKNLEYLNNILSALKQKMSNHVNIINDSIKSKKTAYKMSDINDKNNSNYSNAITSIDNETIEIKKELSNLYYQQDELIKKQRDENKKNNDNSIESND